MLLKAISRAANWRLHSSVLKKASKFAQVRRTFSQHNKSPLLDQHFQTPISQSDSKFNVPKRAFATSQNFPSFSNLRKYFLDFSKDNEQKPDENPPNDPNEPDLEPKNNKNNDNNEDEDDPDKDHFDPMASKYIMGVAGSLFLTYLYFLVNHHNIRNTLTKTVSLDDLKILMHNWKISEVEVMLFGLYHWNLEHSRYWQIFMLKYIIIWYSTNNNHIPQILRKIHHLKTQIQPLK